MTRFQKYGDVFREDRSLRSRLSTRPHTEPRLKGAVLGQVVDTLQYLRNRVLMKKAKKLATDELRSEYKTSDFGVLVRGKYVERLRKSSNARLRALAEIAKRTKHGGTQP